MKNVILLCFVLVSSILTAQDFTSSQNTLLTVNATPGSEILNKLDTYEPKTTREKENYKECKDYERYLMKSITTDMIYELLPAEKTITLQEKDVLKEHIPYGKDGLPIVIIPKSAIKKLGKKGYKSDYYFVVNMATSLNLVMKGLPGQVKPHVTCTIKVFDQNRKQVKKVEEKIKTKTPIREREFPKRKFDKIDKDHIAILINKLKPLMEEAMRGAVKQL